jgi:hypothetical protein
VVLDRGRYRLSSLVYPAVWEPGEPFRASCRRRLAALPWGRLPLHAPPSYDCVCGVYAVRDGRHAVPYLEAVLPAGSPALHRVLGTVSLWGRAVEGDGGFRAEYGYPTGLVVPAPAARRRLRLPLGRRHLTVEEIVEDLAVYGVPVEIGRGLDIVALPGTPTPRAPAGTSLGSGTAAR